MGEDKIRVITGEEVVEIPFKELPAEAEDVIELLKAEEAPLSLWVESAKAYLQAGLVQQFLQIVTEGTGAEVEEHFGASSTHERIQLLCALGSYHTTLGGTQKDRAAQNSHFATASSLFSRALTVSYQELLPHLGLGQLALARRDYVAAQRSFEEAIRHKNNGRQSIAGVLALANLHFQNSNYSEALKLKFSSKICKGVESIDLLLVGRQKTCCMLQQGNIRTNPEAVLTGRYSQALRKHPDSSQYVRVGLALCYMRLNKVSKARAVLERMLQLDPASCPALLGLAFLALASASTDKR
ncbi:hypothetical protein MMC29_000012 [Sticta canariensis]|nr:hypothetical protein [Sticta canariensis]